MRKKINILIILMVVSVALQSCPVCEKQQPALFKGLTHGAGPQSNWDWLIIAIITLITLVTLIYSIKYIVFPKEKNEEHIKNLILNN